MKLFVVAVGQRMPAWVAAGFDEYSRRMPREAPIALLQVKAEPRGESTPVDRLVDAECRRIGSALPPGCFKVVLDERGRGCTTRALSQRLESWQMDGRDIAFVIGGADGLAPALIREADWLWSLSPLTLPHGLVRVIVAEQLYRAWSITKNHPYHRE